MVWGGARVSLFGFNPQPMENSGCTAEFLKSFVRQEYFGFLLHGSVLA